jgi:hypothetical protein
VIALRQERGREVDRGHGDGPGVPDRSQASERALEHRERGAAIGARDDATEPGERLALEGRIGLGRRGGQHVLELGPRGVAVAEFVASARMDDVSAVRAPGIVRMVRGPGERFRDERDQIACAAGGEQHRLERLREHERSVDRRRGLRDGMAERRAQVTELELELARELGGAGSARIDRAQRQVASASQRSIASASAGRACSQLSSTTSSSAWAPSAREMRSTPGSHPSTFAIAAHSAAVSAAPARSQ